MRPLYRVLLLRICVLCLLVIGQAESRINAQSLKPNKVSKVKYVLVKNPAGDPEYVDGRGIVLSTRVEYRVSIEFQFTVKDNDKEIKKINSSRRVTIYKPSDKIKADCSKVECWISLEYFSNDGSSLQFDLKPRGFTNIFIVSWTPSMTETRIALPDAIIEDVESVKKGRKIGIKIKFASDFGPTLVTIMPK